jgi:membrane-associated protease RseP (regulator of RpoE activity)
MEPTLSIQEPYDREVVADAPQSSSKEIRRTIAPWKAGLALAMGLGLLVAYGWFAALAVMFGILLSVTLHECGHFIVARKCGMKCTEFFVGFGPRIWSVKRGETEYGIKALPLGGYVRIIGMHNLEEVAPEDETRTYRAASYGRRIATIFAGPLTNIIIAVAVMAVLLGAVGRASASTTIGSVSDVSLPRATVDALGLQCVADEKVRSVSQCIVEVPAKTAGIQVGDEIRAINGTVITDFSEVRPLVVAQYPESSVLTITRDGTQMDIVVPPFLTQLRPDGTLDPESARVGVSPRATYERVGVVRAIPEAVGEIASMAWSATTSLGRFVSPSTITNMFETATQAPGEVSISDPDVQSRPISVLGVVRLSQEFNSLAAVLALLAGLNVFLAVINLVPLLPFDGGHIAVATYERIRTRKHREYRVDMAKLMPLMYATVLFMALIGFLSIYLDAAHPITTG